MRTISICIPTYNRVEMLFESFAKVIDNDNISEIVIVDDASSDEVYRAIEEKAKDNPKIKLFRNENNMDCYFNKMAAMRQATNKWCILLDSDNVIDFDYLFKLFQIIEWDEHTIYAPDFARPTFCYERFSGQIISKENVTDFIDEPMFQTCLNTCNFFVNRDQYMKIWDGTVDPVTSDSIYFNLKWLEAGNKIHIVDGLKYDHRIHGDSHYNSNNHRTPHGFHDSIISRLRALK
jgi:glycosyltransferase involved in cell wall biosynthesis